MRKLRQESQRNRYTVGVAPCHFQEKVLVHFLAASKYCELHTSPDDLLHHAADKVKTLVVDETGYYTDHRLTVIKHMQFFKKRLAALSLAGNILGGVVLFYLRVS